MGSIFNTPGTLLILKFLNAHYAPGAQFNKARKNGEYNVLRDFGTYGDSYGAAHHLGLHDPSINSRWKKWLDFLDAYQQGFYQGGWLVRNMMADALDPKVSPNCNGIEFFAVPAPGFQVHYPPPSVEDPNNPIQYTTEIVVETNTIDNMVSFTKVKRRKPK